MEVRCEEVSPELAELFWLSSPQATAFNHPRIASQFSDRIRWLGVFKGEVPFLLWPVAYSPSGQRASPPWSYYFGPMWSREASERSVTSQLADSTALLHSAFEVLLQEPGAFACELHPTVRDVRVFDWWNYGGNHSERFSIAPRYSAQLKSLDLRSDDDFLLSMRGVRRREIRRALRAGDFAIVDEVPREMFTLLRTQTIEAQGEVEDVFESATMPALFSLVESGDAHITGVVDTATGACVAANLVLDAGGTSNLVLSVLDPSQPSVSAGPLAVYSALRRSRDRGNTTFDFNGANSPRRGDDKHSYGAEPVLYFRIQFPS
jgi:hypothetical protein